MDTNVYSYSTRTKHSLLFYADTLRGLLFGVNSRMNNIAIAQHLNSVGLPSATGAPWTTAAVSMALHKLRNYRTSSSNLHVALNQLIVDGVVTKEHYLPLLSTPANTVERM